MVNTRLILKLDGKKINFDKIKIKSFSDISIDSRNIRKNFLFVAIKGENNDGHNYLADIFKRGAVAALVNENWYNKNQNNFKDNTFIVVKDTVKSLGELAKLHLKRFNIPILFVGGSNGKTTTKDLIAAVLSKGYKVLKNEGNLNNHIGLPLSVLQLDRYHNMCVLEAGSNHFNELKYLCEIAEPDFGIVTNIGREHLEFFKNLDGVAKEEFSLFKYLIKKDNRGLCFMNFDDDYTRKYFSKNKPSRYFSFAYNYPANVRAKFIKYTDNFEPVIELEFEKKKIVTKVNTFGKHSVYNALAAAAVGLYFGISLNDVKSALENYKPASSKRMEIEKRRGILFVNDAYNSNPDSVKLGLETLKEFKPMGNIHLIISDMLELGESSKKEHTGIGNLIKKMNFENLYTFGNDSKYIFEGAKGIKNNLYFDTKDDLTKYLFKVIGKDDVLYFKGSRGMKLEEISDKVIRGF